MGEVRVGAAKVDITPVTSCWMEGYASRYENGPTSQGIHDPLHARAVLVEGDGGRAALVSCDLCHLSDETIDAVRDLVRGPLGIADERVMIVTTHNHAGPVTGMHDPNGKADGEWLEALAHKMAEALFAAALRLRPATLGVVRGESHVAVNRRETLPDGMVRLGAAPDKPIDPEVIVVTADTPQGEPIARIVNYNCHNTALGPGNAKLSADYAGQAMTAIEGDLGGGAVCPFVNGGAGNADPFHRILPDADDPRLAEVVERFTTDVRAALREAPTPVEGTGVAGAFRDIDLPRKLTAVEAGLGRTQRIRAQAIRFGDVVVVGSPNEVVCEIAMNVKRSSPAAHTLFAGYCYNGAGPWHPGRGALGGYIAAAAHYDAGGYEVRVSPYSADAEAVYTREMIELTRAVAVSPGAES